MRGVVGGEGVVAGAAVGLPGTLPAAVVPPQMGEEHLRVLTRRLQPVFPLQRRAGLRQGGEHEAVPLGEDLVVEARTHPLLAGLEQRRPRLLHGRRPQQVTADRAVQDRVPLEVPLLGDAVPVHHRLGPILAEDLDDLLGRPDVEAALLAFGVGVLGRVEPAGRMAEVAQHVADRLLDHLPVALVARELEGVQVDLDEERLVVEHLLEVRYQPALVDRVPREAAAQVVVDAARRHGVERGRDDLQRAVAGPGAAGPQQELQVHGLGELGRRAESAPAGVERAGQLLQRGVDLGHAGQVLAGAEAGRAVERLHQLRGGVVDLVALVPPGVVDGGHQLQEGGLGEVGAAVERAPVGGEEHRHGPASAAGEGLHGVHVDGVDVRSLLAVDLHVDEQVVHHRRHLGVLEALVGHHVAPVARGVAHREQDRLVLLRRPREGLGTPRVPVDRVVAVLTQVRRGLLGEPVHAGDATGPRRPAPL